MSRNETHKQIVVALAAAYRDIADALRASPTRREATTGMDPITQRWFERRDERWPTHMKASECESLLDLWELVNWWLDKVPDERKDSWYREAGAALRRLYEAAATPLTDRETLDREALLALADPEPEPVCTRADWVLWANWEASRQEALRYVETVRR